MICLWELLRHQPTWQSVANVSLSTRTVQGGVADAGLVRFGFGRDP